MRHLLQSLIISMAVIAIASPSFAGDDRDDKGWDRDKKEHRHQDKKTCKHEDTKDTKEPIWSIFKEGTAKSVKWRVHKPNPRFAIYNAETHHDMTDDLVVDRETGIVWERAPHEAPITFLDAISHCANRGLGGRKGFHVPMVEQLATLVDTNNMDPALPTGHPFLNVQFGGYWSATAYAGNPAVRWNVNFGDGVVRNVFFGSGNFVWCVRGGQSFDGQDLDSLN
jgi:hypothetical protein